MLPLQLENKQTVSRWLRRVRLLPLCLLCERTLQSELYPKQNIYFSNHNVHIVLLQMAGSMCGVSSPSSWPHCCGTLLVPGAAAGSWSPSLPPGCSLSPAAGTPGPQTFWFLPPAPLRPDGGQHTASALMNTTTQNTIYITHFEAIHYWQSSVVAGHRAKTSLK